MEELDVTMLSGLNKKPTRNSFCMLFDAIDNNSGKEVISWILEANFSGGEERPDVLNLLINSEGGSLTDAFAIIDVMASSRIPIQTIGLGQIASAGLLIFIAGSPGRRVLTPNTSILSHRFSAGSVGKSHELFAIGKEFNLTHERMIAHYKKNTGLKEKVIKERLLPPEDVYLNSEEALELNLCDKIADLS